MRKKLFAPLFIFLVFLFSPLSILAVDFQITYIGTLATEGKNYSQWWYSGTQPTLKGTGTAGASVEIKIDETTGTTTVGEDGLWSFTPTTTLTEGDHQVTLTSGAETLSFTLTIGQQPSIASQETTPAAEATSSLPVAGNLNYTLAILILSGAFLFSGVFFLLKTQPLFNQK